MAGSRKLEVQLIGDSRSLERAFGRAGASARGFSRGLTGVFAGIAKGGAFAAGAAAVGGLALVLHEGTKEFVEHQKVAAQTDAALKSTGGVARTTAKRIDQLALSLSNLSGVDDELITSGENVLLSFTKIRNQAGKGNKIFDRATKSVLDFAVRTGRDVPQAALILGKALEDPAKKVSGLARAGIIFTDKQKLLLKSLVETGHTLDAQKLILAEVAKRYGGAAKAAGDTLGGKLNILRERFRDLSGEIVGVFAPAFTKAVDGLTKFIRKLSEAQGIRAKLGIVFDVVVGGLDKARDVIQSAIGDAVAAVDFDAVFARARGIADGLQKRLEEVDFAIVGQRIGDAFVDAVKVALPAVKELTERINRAIRTVDFEALGRQLGPALATAVVTAFVTLTDPAFWIRNWDLALAVGITAFSGSIGRVAGKLVAPLAKLGGDIVLRIGVGMLDAFPRLGALLISALGRLPGLVAKALSPLTGVVSRIFGRLGRLGRFTIKVLGITAAINAVVDLGRRVGQVFRNLGHAIGGALDRAFETMKKHALIAALKIIEPFTHIPGFLGGGAFQDLKRKWQATLDAMVAKAGTSARGINSQLSGIKSRRVQIEIATVTTSSTKGEGGRGGSPRGPAAKSAEASARAAENAAKKQSSTVTTSAQNVAKATTSEATKTETAASSTEKAQTRQRNAFQKMLDGLSLKLDIAGATASFRDDLRAQDRIIAAIKAQIKVEGETTDLLRQLFQVRQQRAEILKQQSQALADQRKSTQFKALGLTGEGEQRVPGVSALRKQLAGVGQAIKGTFLDTGKTKSLLQSIRRVLSGQLGALGRDVRSKVQEMLRDLNQQLSGGGQKGPLTKAHKANINAILRNVGLDPDQIRELRARLSQTISAQPSGRGGRAPAFALAGVRPGGRTDGGITINGNVIVQSDNVAGIEKELQRKARRRGGSRGGVRPGGRSGLS